MKAATHGKGGICAFQALKGLKLEPERRELDPKEFCNPVKERVVGRSPAGSVSSV